MLITLLLSLAGTAFAAELYLEPRDTQGTRPALTFNRLVQGNGGIGFDVSATRSEMIVVQGLWRRDQIAAVRAANPNALILAYKNLSRYQAPDGAGKYNSCLTAQEVTANRFGVDWSSSVADSDAGGNIVRPVAGTGDEYAQLCFEALVRQMNQSAQAGDAVDGIFLDDDSSYSPDVDGGYPDSNLDGTVDDQPRGPDARAWNGWLEQVNRTLSALFRDSVPHKHLAANLSSSVGQRNLESGGWEERQIGLFDSWLAEFTTTWQGGTPIPTRWVNEAFRLIGVSQQKRTVVMVAEPEFTSEARQAYSLGLCLVKTEGYCSKTTGVNSSDQWYPTYDRARALGEPTGQATSPSSGVWVRQFEHGQVKVDLNAGTATFG